MDDNLQATEADHYRALRDNTYAAAERMTDPASQLIIRQIAMCYHRLSLIAEERNQPAAADVPSVAQPGVGIGAA